MMIKVTRENVNDLPISELNKRILFNLINEDLREINKKGKEIYIGFEDEHTEYSPERVDPCPDYYGTYSLHFESSKKPFVDELSIDELDQFVCILYHYLYG